MTQSFTTVLFGLCLLAACAGETTAPPKLQGKPEPEGSAEVVAEASTVKSPASKVDADHQGCIYAEGEKGADPSCPHGPAANGEPATGSAGHFGEPFALGEAVPLSKAVAEGGKAPMLVSGTVEAVCQNKGCWMVIKDGEQTARVMMKNHGFAVPMDSRGKSALVEGELAVRTFSEANVKHLEKDGGGDPSKVSGERTEHVLTASGVEIKS